MYNIYLSYFYFTEKSCNREKVIMEGGMNKSGSERYHFDLIFNKWEPSSFLCSRSTLRDSVLQYKAMFILAATGFFLHRHALKYGTS